jgi:hypothetical protein
MRNLAVSRLILTFLLALAGCVPTSAQNLTPTPTPFIRIHSYFSAYAVLDANGNGKVDPADTPVKDATLIVTLPGGTEFGGPTDETGYAFITIPSDVDYPVTLRMDAPQDSTLEAIEPSTITLLEPTGETIQFLFSAK